MASIALPFLVWMGRGMTFFADEWTFIENRTPINPSNWLQPHNEHWSTIPIVIYGALMETVGLRSYVPYLAVVVGLHVAVALLAYALIRRATGPLFAVPATVVLLLFGGGFENIYWGFQIGFLSSMVFGLLAVIVLDDPPTRRRSLVAAGLLVASLASSGLGTLFVLLVAIESLIDRTRHGARLPVLIAAAVYVAWFLGFGRFGVTRHINITPSTIVQLAETVVRGIGSAVGSLIGLGPDLGILVAIGGAVAIARRALMGFPIPARAVAVVVAIIGQYALITFTRGETFEGFADYTRYTDVSGTLALIGIAAIFGPLVLPASPRRRSLALALGGSVLALSLAFNARLLAGGRQLFLAHASLTRALVSVALERPLPAGIDPSRSLVLVPSPQSLQRIIRTYGSPLTDLLVPDAVPPISQQTQAEAERLLRAGQARG